MLQERLSDPAAADGYPPDRVLFCTLVKPLADAYDAVLLLLKPELGLQGPVPFDHMLGLVETLWSAKKGRDKQEQHRNVLLTSTGASYDTVRWGLSKLAGRQQPRRQRHQQREVQQQQQQQQQQREVQQQQQQQPQQQLPQLQPSGAPSGLQPIPLHSATGGAPGSTWTQQLGLGSRLVDTRAAGAAAFQQPAYDPTADPAAAAAAGMSLPCNSCTGLLLKGQQLAASILWHAEGDRAQVERDYGHSLKEEAADFVVKAVCNCQSVSSSSSSNSTSSSSSSNSSREPGTPCMCHSIGGCWRLALAHTAAGVNATTRKRMAEDPYFFAAGWSRGNPHKLPDQQQAELLSVLAPGSSITPAPPAQGGRVPAGLYGLRHHDSKSGTTAFALACSGPVPGTPAAAAAAAEASEAPAAAAAAAAAAEAPEAAASAGAAATEGTEAAAAAATAGAAPEAASGVLAGSSQQGMADPTPQLWGSTLTAKGSRVTLFEYCLVVTASSEAAACKKHRAGGAHGETADAETLLLDSELLSRANGPEPAAVLWQPAPLHSATGGAPGSTWTQQLGLGSSLVDTRDAGAAAFQQPAGEAADMSTEQHLQLQRPHQGSAGQEQLQPQLAMPATCSSCTGLLLKGQQLASRVLRLSAHRQQHGLEADAVELRSLKEEAADFVVKAVCNCQSVSSSSSSSGELGTPCQQVLADPELTTGRNIGGWGLAQHQRKGRRDWQTTVAHKLPDQKQAELLSMLAPGSSISPAPGEVPPVRPAAA